MDDSQSALEVIRTNLQTQLDEIESLQSMFYNPGEIRIEDLSTVANIKAFLNKEISTVPPNLDITITLTINDQKFELCANLSYEYPNVEPELFVRSHNLNRVQHKALNKELNLYMSNLDRGEPCIFSAISWLQDNGSNYLEEVIPKQVVTIVKNETLIRYWIYSHHIYSKTKRREILHLAHDLNLSGFALPGRPGIICVEGMTTDCEEWWQAIKSMNWKKIYCKVVEENKEEKDDFLKFSKFEEIAFQSSGVKCTHMDMGSLYKYLEDHKVGYIFKEIFGVDAKLT